jgi:hypothetical protein
LYTLYPYNNGIPNFHTIKDLVDSLYKQIEKIKDADIQKFTKLALDNAPAEFWIAPCSSSGHHHPPEDNGEGGTLRHKIKCIYIGSDLAARVYNLPEIKVDVVRSGLLLHDVQKNGIPWGNKTHVAHGLIAYVWLQQFPLKQPEKEEICNCVRYHMGQWSQPAEEAERALKPTITEMIVQLTDYVCSREYASFLPGIGLSEDIIKSYSL